MKGEGSSHRNWPMGLFWSYRSRLACVTPQPLLIGPPRDEMCMHAAALTWQWGDHVWWRVWRVCIALCWCTVCCYCSSSDKISDRKQLHNCNDHGCDLTMWQHTIDLTLLRKGQKIWLDILLLLYMFFCGCLYRQKTTWKLQVNHNTG